MGRNHPLPLVHPRTIRNLTACANCKQHGPDRQPVCLASGTPGDPVVECAKHDYCPHPDGPKFGNDQRPHTFPQRGLGDTIARFLEWAKLAKPAKYAIAAATGKKGCGCGKRANALNQLVPAKPVE